MSKHHKAICLKEIGLSFQLMIITIHSIVSTTGRTYSLVLKTNTHALSITITKLGQVRFLHIFYCIFANAIEFFHVNLIGRSWRT